MANLRQDGLSFCEAKTVFADRDGFIDAIWVIVFAAYLVSGRGTSSPPLPDKLAHVRELARSRER